MGNPAKIRYRISTLSQEDQATLNQLRDYGLTSGRKADEVLDYLEENGKFPSWFESGKVPKAYLDIAAKLPSTKDAKTNYLKNQLADTPNLSDEQLQEKKQLLTDMNKPTVNEPADLKSYFKANIKSKLEPYFGNGITSDQVDSIVNYSVDSLHQGNYDPQGVIDRIVSFVGGGGQSKEGGFSGSVLGNRNERENIGIARAIAEDIRNDYYRETGSGKYDGSSTSADPAYGLDLKAVGDVIADRGVKANLEAQYNEFAASAPGQLAADRKAFYDAQRVRAKDYITGEYAPQVAERLNAIGLGDSVEVGASIASKYLELLGGVDSGELNQLEADTQFFGQQAYQKTFQDLIAARTDVSGTIASERNVLRTNQGRGFANSQADIEKRFSLDLFRQQSQAAYNNYQAQVNKQRQTQRETNTAQNIGQVGQVVGQVAGAYAGSGGGGSTRSDVPNMR